MGITFKSELVTITIGDFFFNPNFAVAKFLRSSDEKLALLPIFVKVNPDKLRFVGPSGRFCSWLQNLGSKKIPPVTVVISGRIIHA